MFSFFLLFAFTSSVKPSVSFSSPVKQAQTVTNDGITYYDSTRELTTEDEYVTARIRTATATSHSLSYTIYFSSEDVGTYLFGYYGDKDTNDYWPLVAAYQLENKETGEVEDHYQEQPLTSTINNYDGIGLALGATEMTLNLDFIFDDAYTFVDGSLKLYNIFDASTNTDNSITYDATDPYVISEFTGKTSATDISPYFTTTLLSYSVYHEYATFEVQYSLNIADLYKTAKESSYTDNEEDINNGTMKLQALFPSLSAGYFRLAYQDGTVNDISLSENIKTNSQTLQDGTFTSHYLLENVSTDNLESFSLCGLTLTIQIANVLEDGTEKVIPGTSTRFRLGCLYFDMPDDDISKVGVTNVQFVILLTLILSIVIGAGFFVGLYFYRKNKYKNDEFRRVNTKRFVLTSAVTLTGVVLFILDVLYIYFRATAFNNTLTCFNPLDNFIVAFSVLLIFFIGYGIKYLISFIKDTKARKEAKRLKLDEDAQDDGTK